MRGGQTLKEAGVFPLPRCLLLRQETAGLTLTRMIVATVMTEPTLWCRGSEELFAEDCDASHGHLFLYSLVSMMATLIYFILLMVLAVFSMGVSAYLLVGQRKVVEVGLFIFALGFAIFMTAAAASVPDQTHLDFAGIHKASLALLKMFMHMYVVDKNNGIQEEPNSSIVSPFS